MSSKPFVHLHCHSHYSLLDGASSIDRLVDAAKRHGMNSLALTDHGNLHGALEFYQKANAAGIKPIIGYEAYIAPASRFSKDAGNMKEASFHLTLLAQNEAGYKNLIKMASAAFLEGFYFKPRIDKELLAAHSEGVICLSGCVSGELSRSLLRGGDGDEHLQKAIEIAEWFQKTFGDRYFIEIQNNGLDIQRQALLGSVELAQRMDLPLVATSDCHYVNQEDAEAQDILLCINTGKFRTDTKRMKMEGDQFFVRPPQDMYAAFPGHEDAVARSQQIADTVDLELKLGQRHFPKYDLPPETTPKEFLYDLCITGLTDRYSDVPEMWDGDELSQEVMDRVDRELGVINKLGFPNYFIIVWDFVREARRLNIPTTARGSGVGSLVCFALYMSHVCPLKYDLLFERFLDENRLEAPDIDIDFCKLRRAEIIRYVKDKYGESNVAQIGTFGTLAARAAIRDVGRALGWPISRVDQLVAMVPDQLGIKLADAIEKSAELGKAYKDDPDARELLDLAKKIEGLARNVGTHAAAVVISDKPLTEYVPLGTVTGKTDVLTQWAMNDVEAAGLLKMDFLGLRNLTILAKSVELIEQTTGEKIDPYKFPMDDADTFALLCRGETKGIFQLESGGIRDLLQRMKPDHFRDIIATNALYRPGPLEGGMVDDYVEVKHGRQEAVYPHPVMKEILAETHGVMVYQEQVMRVLNRLGGIPLASAYTCIKAISKKKLATIAKFKQTFIEGATEKGLDKKKAVDLFEMIEKFAGYGFNKSHSTAYALIAYMTAYLKAHYPVEFMAALLTGDIPGRNFKRKDNLVEHQEDCRRMNVTIVPPDVNSSGREFTVSDGKIHFALSAIKGCGEGAADAIVAAREKDGPFRSLFDFCERIEPASCNRAAIETLIKAGAFDSLGARRAQLAAVVDRALQSGASVAKDRKSGQKGLFDDVEDEEDAQDPAADLPDVPEHEEREKLAMEKEVLGFYLSSHPLAQHAGRLSLFCSHTTAQIPKLAPRTDTVLGGMLTAIKITHTKKARSDGASTKYAMFDLEDLEGMVRCIIWPEQYAQFGHLVEADAILVVRGRVDRRPGSEESNLIVNELIALDALDEKYTKGLVIRVDERQHDEQVLSGLHEILRGYPGTRELQLVICLADGSKVYIKSAKMHISLDQEMRRRIDDLLGPGNVRAITAVPKPSTEAPPKRRGAYAG
ncbi:MAG: DNA polymerase III subunit alpha [Planctomycetes bacterium]|nr:DNA polymerase III subunit alpha [Planctomycetota bacterium]